MPSIAHDAYAKHHAVRLSFFPSHFYLFPPFFCVILPATPPSPNPEEKAVPGNLHLAFEGGR
jgi:hypothetical protein